MRHLTHPVLAVLFWGVMGVVLTGCGPTRTAEQKPDPTEIRGEPIALTKSSVSVPAVAPISVAPAVSTEVKVVDSIAPLSDLGYAAIGFDKLASYKFEVDEAPFTNQNASADRANDQIPPTIKALSEKKISIKGFMLPLKVSDGVVTEFLIMKDQSMCCFGTVPKINEWISVKTTGAGVKPIMDQPVSMLGTLHVGALRENGYLVGIYQMDGDKLGAIDN